MAKAISARRQGDEFQALFFWKQLIYLLIDDNLKRITFESDRQIFVDDLVVEYSKPVLDEYTGQQYCIDAYQCKYHVSRNTIFSVDKIIDPDFIKNNQSMLQRLYEAYLKYSKEGEMFRLHIVSSSGWDPNDAFCRFLSSENHVRWTFFEKGANSIQGRIRKRLADHLQVSEAELRRFIPFIRFDLGLSCGNITEILSANLKLAGLLPLEKTITNTRYAELAWKWLEQGPNSFDRPFLDQILLREKLLDTGIRSLLIIRHQSLDPIMPDAIREDIPDHMRRMQSNEIAVDLTHLFREGQLTNPQQAIKEQEEKTIEITQLCKSNPNIDLAYYGIAHIPLVFLLGYRLNLRKRINLFEHDRKQNRWNLLQTADKFPDLVIRGTFPGADDSFTEVVLKFGISYPIVDADLNEIVPGPGSILELTVPSPALDSIRNVDQLETYASAFRAVLDRIHNLGTSIERVHVFYAGPVSLAFRCGQLISPTIHPRILVYNYFSHGQPKYKWGIHVNAPATASDFLVQL
ncbi:MAG: SAVED domain-containing protein [Anaerolineales bacterium]